MESIVVACITGMVTLVGVILSNLKSRAVMELKIDALAEKVEKHNQLVERTYQLQQDVAVVRNDIEALCKRTEATTRAYSSRATSGSGGWLGRWRRGSSTFSWRTST